MVGNMVAGRQLWHWKSIQELTSKERQRDRETEEGKKRDRERYRKNSKWHKHTSSNKITPTPRPHFLKMPLPMGQLFKLKSVWGSNLFRPPQLPMTINVFDSLISGSNYECKEWFHLTLSISKDKICDVTNRKKNVGQYGKAALISANGREKKASYK